jgi:hypothetical protein
MEEEDEDPPSFDVPTIVDAVVAAVVLSVVEFNFPASTMTSPSSSSSSSSSRFAIFTRAATEVDDDRSTSRPPPTPTPTPDTPMTKFLISDRDTRSALHMLHL